MGRRRQSSPADDLLEVIAWMPWWAGIALAVASYVVLHHIASQPVTALTQPGQLGAFVTQALQQVLAAYGQYIVPLICLAGAGTSAWRRQQRRKLVTQVAEARSAEVLRGMGWQQFEQLVGEGFRRLGYRVAETGGGGPDGGVDLVLNKGSEQYLVQCKQWRALKVGVDVVRELYGVMAAQGAAGGFVVTSGRFTADASAFAKGRNVDLIDGTRLQALIQQSARRDAKAGDGTLPASGAPMPAAHRPPSEAASSMPECPRCAKPMVKRTAKRGPQAGASFWGCSAYPACRGTRAGL